MGVHDAVRHERPQKVVDVVVAPCTAETSRRVKLRPLRASTELRESNTFIFLPCPIWKIAPLTVSSAAFLPILAIIAFLICSKYDIWLSNDRYWT